MKKFTLFLLAMMVSVVSAFAGITVTTSMDGKVVTKLSDLDNLTLTFPGVSTVTILGEEDCQYLALQNEDGSELYGIWGPTMGSQYTIDGNTITLDGFMTMEGATIDIPAGTTKLYIEDYGTLALDGEEDYLPTMEFDANITEQASQPFALTSVSNNGVDGSIMGVEASEQGVFYQFIVTATGKALSQGTAVPTLQISENSSVDFGAASILAYEQESAMIRFMGPQQYYFTTPGTYVLTIPEGTFVDAEGNPNAAVAAKWIVIQGAEPETFAITGANFGGAEAGAEVEALSYMATITAANAITALHEGNITLTDENNQPVGGYATVMGYEGDGGSNTVYARFNFDSEDHMLHTAGTYTLNIPAGMFADAEGNLSEAYTATWTVKESAEAGTFAITAATFGGAEAGAEVEALSYMATITAANAITALHEGNITLTDENNQPVGGYATVMGYESDGGSNTVYARFNFDSEDHMLHTAGTYTLNIPAGMFADAEGNLSEAYTATWTVKESAEAGTFAITGANFGGAEAGAEVEALSYMATITAANAITGLHEGNITLTDENNQPVGGNAYVMGYEGEGGSTSVYARFNFDSEDHMLHAAGTYTLNIPAGMFVDAEGNLSEAYTATWTVKESAEAGTFAITGATNAGVEPETEVEVLSYSFAITAANAITGLHSGNITLTDANNQPVGGNAYVYGYEGEGGSTTVYARFNFDTEDHQLHAAGTYTLNVPAGMFVDAEGNLSEAYTATWTVKEVAQNIVIENVQIATTTNTWGDTKYTATVQFAKPAGAAFVYTEGLSLSLNGEQSTKLFQAPDYGFVELGEEETVTIVFTDDMKAATTDPEGVDTENVRQPGTYVGSLQMMFMDENGWEIMLDEENVLTASFTGSVVLPKVADAAAMAIDEDAQWATFVAPFAVAVPEGVTAYTVNGIEGTTLVLNTVEATIPANTPVVLYAESGLGKTFFGEATEGEAKAGLLTGVYEDADITEGYVLQNQEENGVGFYLVEGHIQVPANHAYLTVPASEARFFGLGGETAIKAIDALTNGKAEIYDLNGRKLNSLQKGINIVNGVKILVK